MLNNLLINRAKYINPLEVRFFLFLFFKYILEIHNKEKNQYISAV